MSLVNTYTSQAQLAASLSHSLSHSMTLIGNAAVFGREHEASFATVQLLDPVL
jgi:hypothetical protein